MEESQNIPSKKEPTKNLESNSWLQTEPPQNMSERDDQLLLEEKT